MPQIGRRSLLSGVAGAGLTGAGALLPGLGRAGVQLADAYKAPVLKFRVERDGSPIGVVMERFQGIGDALRVDVYIALQVKLAFVTVFRYEHRSREIWRGGRLVQLDSVTNDDGTAQAVTVRPYKDRLAISGPNGNLSAPADILPSSYWHPAFVEQSRMLDSQKGRVLEFRIEPAGAEAILVSGNRRIEATRYRMRGDVDLDFWYDDKRRWRKMAFTIKGGSMEYFEIAPSPEDQSKFDTALSTGARIPAL